MFKFIIFIFLLGNMLYAQDYFILLTESAAKNRSLFLNNRLDQISGVQNNAVLKSSDIQFFEAAPFSKENQPFNRWLILRTVQNTGQIAEMLASESLIDFYEPVGRFRIDFESNDSLSAQQWYLDKIEVAQAWQIGKGSPDIIVSVIDTGIDFVHPDLEQSIWINTAEDLNGNGMFDEQDLNYIDDDQNGYVDDVAGWDFTDAPRFADGGDYRDEDNQPWDEFSSGHGTQAAGIIAARDNNGIGIAGIAPGLKIMNLRAGTANGYLEEDDVGRAVLYALNNGARIINMSFGDKALSRFLRDVISFAAQQGMIFIASSGNENSSEPHYPSSLAQVISVGASTKNDGIAGFSNYGNTLDIVAPGSDMISTAIGGKYNSVGGTSFSAPVVSAVAGLLLSLNGALSAEQLRNILKTSAEDIYYQGWDSLSAAGRVSAYNALRVPAAGVLKITYPEINSSIAADEIAVIGSAAHPDLIYSEVNIGKGDFPSFWTSLVTSNKQQVIDDTLALLSSLNADTTYTLQIKMHLLNGRTDEQRHSFKVDNTAARISELQIIDLWDGPVESKLITFITDDVCSGTLFARPENSDEPFIPVVSPYQTTNHRFKLDKSHFEGKYTFYIEAKNGSGLTSADNNNGNFFSFSLNKEVSRAQFNRVPWILPAGFMLDKVTDFDHDGQHEIVLSRYDDNSGFGPVEVYEFNNGMFELRLRSGFTAIPRAAGDTDNDGHSEILMGFGQNSFLFESSAPDSFPKTLIWKDTVNFWAADFTDLDGDNVIEISGRVDNEYVILEYSGNNMFTEIGRLSNTTAGENRLGVPAIEVLDINNDGNKDLVFGDYDGDILVYSSSADNSFYLLTESSTLHGNAVEIMSSDLQQTFFTATHTSQNLNYEHEFDARYWSVESFSGINQQLVKGDPVHTFGFSDTRDFDSGLDYSIFDGQEYLFASFFPGLYLFRKAGNSWQLSWYHQQARSNAVLVHDFDNDGNEEFYFNDGQQIIGYTAMLSERPSAPLALVANPRDSITVILHWQKVTGAVAYNVYRGNTKSELELQQSVTENIFTDLLEINTKYFYAVTSIDPTFTTGESFFSNIDSVKTTSPPEFDHYEFSGDRHILLFFDKALALDPDRPAVIYRSSQKDFASSVIILNQNSLLCSFTESFSDGKNDTLSVADVFGESLVPVDIQKSYIPVKFTKTGRIPYVKDTDWITHDRLMIVFSEPMDFDNGPVEFRVVPSGRTKSIKKGDSLSTSLIVDFSSDTYIGAAGVASYLILEGLSSSAGVFIDGDTRISLFRETDNLKNIKVYPQPVKPKHNTLVFANLPGDVKITIYNMNGRPVKHLSEQTFYGGVNWDLKDDQGNDIASGIYVYNMTWENKSEQGKIVIIR